MLYSLADVQSKYKTLNDNGMTQVYKKKQQSERIRNDNGMTQVYKKKQQSERTRNDNGMTHVYREKHPTFSLGLLRSDLVPASFQSVSDSEASIERHRNEDGGPNERNENEEGADCGSFLPPSPPFHHPSVYTESRSSLVPVVLRNETPPSF